MAKRPPSTTPNASHTSGCCVQLVRGARGRAALVAPALPEVETWICSCGPPI